MRKIRELTVYFTGRIYKEGEYYVAECISLPVVTQGETAGEAMGNLTEAIELFVGTCLARGTLERVLLKHNWRPRLNPPRQLAKDTFSLPVPVPPQVYAQRTATSV